MNALINTELTVYQKSEKEDNINRKTFGDILAVSLVGGYTLCALVISSWSAVLLLTGRTSDGGPIGLIVNTILSSGLL